MQPIVSVDLAYRTYRDTGIAALRSHERHVECACTDLARGGLSGEPDPPPPPLGDGGGLFTLAARGKPGGFARLEFGQ